METGPSPEKKNKQTKKGQLHSLRDSAVAQAYYYNKQQQPKRSLVFALCPLQLREHTTTSMFREVRSNESHRSRSKFMKSKQMTIVWTIFILQTSNLIPMHNIVQRDKMTQRSWDDFDAGRSKSIKSDWYLQAETHNCCGNLHKSIEVM